MRGGIRLSARVGWCGVVATMALGCGSIDDALDAHGPTAAAKMAKVDQVRALVAAAPRVTADAVKAKGPFTLAFKEGGYEQTDAAVVYLEDLRAPGELGTVYARVDGTRAISECQAFLAHQTYPWDPADAESWARSLSGSTVERRLEQCGRLEHLLVVRTVEFFRPSPVVRLETSPAASVAPAPSASGAPSAAPGEVPGGGVDQAAMASDVTCRAAGARCVFDGGYVRAEVLVFALDPVQQVGGFVVEAESHATAIVSTVFPIEKDLESDLRLAVTRELKAAIIRNVPGSKVIR